MRRSVVFNPLKALLAKFGYHKFEKIEKFDRETLGRIAKNQPRKMWDDIARSSPTNES